jgi:hypothetical protein
LDALNTNKLPGGQLWFCDIGFNASIISEPLCYLINDDSKELALLFNLKKRTGAKSNVFE